MTNTKTQQEPLVIDDHQKLENFCKRMDDAGTRSSAHQEFFEAAKRARLGMSEDGLSALINADGEFYYLDEQVAKATHDAREDVAAVLMLQLSLLKRLDRNRNYLLVVIVILFFIALRIA